MGCLNPSLLIDRTVLNAALRASDKWNSNSFSHSCKSLECRLESEFRSELISRGLRLKYQGSRRCGLPNCSRFSFSYQTAPDWQYETFRCSSDTVYEDGISKKLVVCELKVVDHYMKYLQGKASSLSTPVGATLPIPGRKLHAPITKVGGVDYVAHLAEGQVLLDIVRLVQSKKQYPCQKTETYQAIFSPSRMNGTRLSGLLESFDKRSRYIHHRYGHDIRRSCAVDFQFNWLLYPLDRHRCNVAIVRIEG